MLTDKQIDRIKIGTKFKVEAPTRPKEQIGTGVGVVTAKKERYNIILAIMKGSEYPGGTYFTLYCKDYRFKILKY